MADTSLGTMFVSFGADLTGFKSGVTEMKSSLGDIKSTTSEAGSGISSIFSGVVSGAFGMATQAVGFLKNQISDSIQVAEVHQGVMTQTAQAIKSTGDASGMSASAIDNLALSLSKTTTFSDDTIQSGENLLLTFTGIGKDVFPQTTKTMLDMAQAMGGDTKGAALMLGKALNDPATGLTALTRVGVTFSAQEKEQIKTMMAHNDVVGAQKLMLKELQTEFGGSAEAAGKTFAGSLQILKNDMMDVKQQIGGALLPVFQSFTGFVTSTAMPILEGLGNWFSSTIGPALKGFSDDVGKAITYVGNVLRTVDLSDFADAWTDVKQSVNELGQTFQSLGSKLHPIVADFDPLADTIQRLAQGALNTLTGMLWKAYEAISAVSGIFHGGKGPLEDFGNSLKQIGIALQPAAAILAGQFKADLAWLGNTFNQIGGWIQSSLMPALATLIPPFMSIANTVATNILPALAEFYATGHQLVESMLTPLIGVLEKIIPPIISIAGWLAGALAAGFQFVAPLVKGLADAISNVVNFFTKTEVGVALVKAALIALSIPVGILSLAFLSLAVESIAAFIMSIPAMVGGFLAGASAAWGMALAVLSATWPFLVIVGVIAGVILAIQHWGDIANWLQGAWGAFSSWFMGALGAVGNFFHNIWNGIVGGLKVAWDAIVNVVKIGALLLLSIILGPFIAIGAAFVWLYNHNTYFKDLIDSITNTVKAGVTWLQNTWQSIINWIVNSWQSLVNQATVLWDSVSMQIKIGWMKAVKYVQDVWNAISSFFVNAWNTYIAGPLISLWTTVSTFFSNVWSTYIVKPLTTMWTNVSSFFSGVWNNYIAGPIGSLWNQLTNTIGGWAGKAVDWGKNLIKSFVNGIVSMSNSVAGAVGGIAGKVLAFLGFHSPTKEGPGQEADAWAPNFIKMYTKGLTDGLPQIQNAVNKLSTPLALNFNSRFQYPSMAAQAASSPQIVVHVHNDKPAPIYIDGHELTNSMAPHIASMIRLKGDVRAR